MANKVELYLSNPVGVALEDDEIQLPEEYEMYWLIRKMGWDYETYLRQPDWFIEMTLSFLIAEMSAERKRKQNAK